MVAQRLNRVRRWVAGVVAVGIGVGTLTGCTPSEPAPTGDALYAEAEAHYLSYREFVNGLQSEYSTGPWKIGQLGSYGMQPLACDGERGYQYHLHRSLRLDPAGRDSYADTAMEYLTAQGMSPGRGLIGADDHEGQVLQVIVRDEGDFSVLLIEFLKNGNIGITVDTTCWPGDRDELRNLLFGGFSLSDGYLPMDFEAPTDPLFFGVTEGDPQFLDPTPTETPSG